MIKAHINWFIDANTITSLKNVDISPLNDLTEEVSLSIVKTLEEKNENEEPVSRNRLLMFRGVGLVSNNAYLLTTSTSKLSSNNAAYKQTILNNTISDLAVLSFQSPTNEEGDPRWNKKMVRMNHLLKRLETVGVVMIRRDGEIINDYEDFKDAITSEENPLIGVTHAYVRNAVFGYEEPNKLVRRRY